MLQHFVGINLNSWLSIGQYILSVTLIFLHNKNYKKNFKYLAMYSATGEDVLFFIFFIFAEKNLSYHISSFNESTGFGLLKASPEEFVKYPFYALQNKILFSKVLWIFRQYSKQIVLISFSWYHSPTEMTPVPAPTSSKVLSYHHNFQGLTGTAFSLVFFISTFAGVPISSTS